MVSIANRKLLILFCIGLIFQLFKLYRVIHSLKMYSNAGEKRYHCHMDFDTHSIILLIIDFLHWGSAYR